ncbi:MAG: hypothetical protein JRH08_00790 [Deltaproteobacteria bacterium]|nr:hypothetical protein [Deltaproteobacteria bacterium]MBW2025699.1 hypothetical protein [Deltaproteobacteria bacterium]MBW2124240.1 hypothetical protein [Deltaproteobacteria bacterium]
MWESIAGGGFVALLFGFILNGFRGRLNRVEQCKVDSKVCIERHANIEQSLSRGDEKFQRIDEKLDIMTQALARIEERVKNL